jgi:arsenical pump membrane protein
MMLPAATSIAVSYVGLRISFRRTIPADFRRVQPVPQIERPRFLVASAGILLLTLAGFFSEPITGIPTAYVAAGGAALLFLVNHVSGGRTVDVVRGVSWDVIGFVIGMFLVAQGLRTSGLTDAGGQFIGVALRAGEAAATLATGLTAGVFSAVLNNHPVASMTAMTIGDLQLDGMTTRVLALSALIGGDLGPRMLPIGSLAALMWFRILRGKGVHIPYAQYVRLGVPITLIAIVLSVLVLNLEFAIAGLR